MSETLTCPYCKRSDFKSARGLTQHQTQNLRCKTKKLSLMPKRSGNKPGHKIICTVIEEPLPRTTKTRLPRIRFTCNQSVLQPQTNVHLPQDDDNLMDYDVDSTHDPGTENVNPDINIFPDPPITGLRTMFDKYVCYAETKLDPFTPNQEQAIKLLSVLRQTSASLNTYEAILHWHLCLKMRYIHIKKCQRAKTTFPEDAYLIYFEIGIHLDQICCRK